jgi:hypothetical protein
MLIDLFADAPALFLVVGVAAYGAVLARMVAGEIERARWRREFGGWRALPRGHAGRIAVTAWRTHAQSVFLRGAASLERLRLHGRDSRYGWRVLQRRRIALRRGDRETW